MHDPVNHPDHYTDGGIETIDFIEAKKLPYHLGNAVKYISRSGKKGTDKTVEDLKKAVWYLQRYIMLNDPKLTHGDLIRLQCSNNIDLATFLFQFDIDKEIPYCDLRDECEEKLIQGEMDPCGKDCISCLQKWLDSDANDKTKSIKNYNKF